MNDQSSKGAHTPGPWEFDRDWQRTPTIFGCDRQMVAHIEKHKRMTTNPGPQFDLPERDANARLIVAAPDMLAALQAIVHPDNEALCWFVTSDSHAMKLRDDVRAAIAKALGSAS